MSPWKFFQESYWNTLNLAQLCWLPFVSPSSFPASSRATCHNMTSQGVPSPKPTVSWRLSSSIMWAQDLPTVCSQPPLKWHKVSKVWKVSGNSFLCAPPGHLSQPSVLVFLPLLSSENGSDPSLSNRQENLPKPAWNWGTKTTKMKLCTFLS